MVTFSFGFRYNVKSLFFLGFNFNVVLNLWYQVSGLTKVSLGNLLEQMITEDMGIGIHSVFVSIVFHSCIISLIQ